MSGLKNRDETLIFMWRHFDETMTILISHFLRFGAIKTLSGDFFVLRINEKNICILKKKMDVLLISVFSQHFSYNSFPHSLRTGWRTNGV